MSSGKPLQFTRKWYLNQLCIAIFGNVKINYYDDGAIEINNNSGLADKAIFDTIEKMARTRARMEILFYYTFLSESAQFRLTGKQKAFCRNDAIANACEYFRKNGVTISSFASTDAMIPSIILMGLNYVLAAIFQAEPESDRDYSTEDISSRFRDMLSAFEKELLKNNIVSGADIDNCECYYNSMFFDESNYRQDRCISAHLGDCNYAIPLNLNTVFEIPNYDSFKIRIPQNPCAPHKTDEQEWLEEMLSGYYAVSSEYHALSDLSPQTMPYSPDIIPITEEYTLSCINEIAAKINKKDVYYLTKLNKSTLESLYPACKTHDALHLALMKEAKEKIMQQNSEYKSLAAEWSICVLKDLEDILQRFSQICSFREFLSGDTPSIEHGQEMLSVFDIDYNLLLEKMIGFQDDTEKWGVIYIAIENAFTSYFSQFITDIRASTLPSIVSFLAENVSSKQLKEHIKRNKDELSSDSVMHAITLQNDITPKSIPIIDSDRNPFLLPQKREEHIAELILEYMHKYHDILSNCMQSCL